ncbi:MAG: large-conductance mechanosensitive channel protein MscL [Muribaculaceae bacterium]|nr:large-conductance mechanosensitive channel protein MscL [Muribaculaceae bacterium]
MGKFIEDFKAFALKGNVIDMAVGVIVGGAFGKIVSSLVNDIIMPVITLCTGGTGFENMKFVIKHGIPATEEGQAAVEEVAVHYGTFIQNIVDFFIIAFSIFVAIRVTVKFQEKWKKDEETAAAEPTPEPAPTKEEVLLGEIRDLLKQQNTDLEAKK